jgi:hypothetical protein
MKTEFTKGIWEINKTRNVKCNGITIANCSEAQEKKMKREEKLQR